MAPMEIASHWSRHLVGVRLSSKEFYNGLRERLEELKLEGVQIGTIDLPEAGLFSPKRTYLRIVRGDHMFDICAAPYANGFFHIFVARRNTAAGLDSVGFDHTCNRRYS